MSNLAHGVSYQIKFSKKKRTCDEMKWIHWQGLFFTVVNNFPYPPQEQLATPRVPSSPTVIK